MNSIIQAANSLSNSTGILIPKGKFRETFGVIDSKTMQLYPDLLAYKLAQLEVNQSILSKNWIEKDGLDYQIHMDSKTKRAIRDTGIGDFLTAIVSYQIRTQGNFAFVRIYQSSKSPE